MSHRVGHWGYFRENTRIFAACRAAIGGAFGFESHWGHIPSGRGSHLAELRRRIDELPENLAAPHACASRPRSAARYSRICDGVEPFVSAWCFRSADRTALRMTAHVISRLTAATISPMRRE